jgi:dienelactone hydrolase
LNSGTSQCSAPMHPSQLPRPPATIRVLPSTAAGARLDGSLLTRRHGRHTPSRLPQAALIAVASIFVLSAWQANCDVCPGCQTTDIELSQIDGTHIHARLYLPQGPARDLGAVIVCHGYLANLAFMEIPWAAELTSMGVAAMFVDRRGAGQSSGKLWLETANGNRRVDDLEPDITAALTDLRRRAPLIDPDRISLLGHSDGATAAITAASLDWDLRSTVAVSASVAPWELVNHVGPRNLLLIYGADDHFVLNSTDRILIAHATRGYLTAPGSFGSMDDGTARQLLRIPGRGHVDVLYSESAQREALQWVRRSLQAPGNFTVSDHRLMWIWSGLVALAFLLLLRCDVRISSPSSQATSDPHDDTKSSPLTSAISAAVAVLMRTTLVILWWACGLAVAAWLSRSAQGFVPAQEGSVYAGLLIGPLFTLTFAAGGLLLVQRLRNQQRTGEQHFTSGILGDAIRGAIGGTGMFICIHILVLHHYEVSLESRQRIVLFLLFLVLALPALGSLEFWLRWASRDWVAAGAASQVLVAGTTAFLASRLFERMSMAPPYLLAAVLVLAAAYRMGDRPRRPVSSVVFAAGTFAWVGAVTCALY